jgi:hypothetical protein
LRTAKIAVTFSGMALGDTSLLERSLGEVKRRIHFNALDRQRLKRSRYQGNERTIPQEVTAD